MKRQPQPGGFVLIMVLVVIMLASMVAASLLFVLSAEHTASAASQGGEQAWATAMSGVYHAIRIATDPATDPADLPDNPTVFRDQLVSDDGVQKWYFSVYSLPDTAGGAVRYGLTDEASRINVYQATAAMLATLPNFTPQLAQSLLSALPGTTPAPATNTDADALSALSGLLAVTNAPNPRWTCLDELLDVSGFSPALLYGSYSNLTGRVLAQTVPAEAVASTNATPGDVEVGLNQFLTVCSYDLNQDSDGKPRINLNQPDADLSGAGLSDATLAYLAALGTNGLSLTNTVDLLWATNMFKDAKGNAVAMGSGISPAELPGLLDHCTTTNATNLVGLVNLNTASAPVLAALPGMNEALAESIIAARVGLSPDARKTTAWVLQEGIVTADIFKQMAPYLTTRGYQFHFFAAGYSVPSGNYRVIEAVVDVAAQPPAVLLLRDASRLGLPFDPSAPLDPAGAPAARPAAPSPFTSQTRVSPGAINRLVTPVSRPAKSMSENSAYGRTRRSRRAGEAQISPFSGAKAAKNQSFSRAAGSAPAGRAGSETQARLDADLAQNRRNVLAA